MARHRAPGALLGEVRQRAKKGWPAGLVVLSGDFVFDGAPDPYVALGSGRKPFAGGLIAELGANQGAQTYTIDAVGLEDAREVIIWCKKYAVPLGVAPIN